MLDFTKTSTRLDPRDRELACARRACYGGGEEPAMSLSEYGG